LRRGEAWIRSRDELIEKPRSVGGRIKLERIRQGLTLAELAERAGLSSAERIRQIERSNSLSAATILRFAEVLGVSVDYLLDNTEELDPTYSNSEGSLKKRLELLGRFEGVFSGSG
jgi:transcriptional regulator with XRE-family HTH domain